MNLYHVEPSGYGTMGWFVIAESEETAKGYCTAKYPHYELKKLYVTLIGPVENGLVSQELLW